MAMGASPGNVLRLIVGGGMKLALVGVVAGLLGAVGAAKLLASLLKIDALDLMTCVTRRPPFCLWWRRSPVTYRRDER
jgi:putative ABC transport system permease protein